MFPPKYVWNKGMIKSIEKKIARCPLHCRDFFACFDFVNIASLQTIETNSWLKEWRKQVLFFEQKVTKLK